MVLPVSKNKLLQPRFKISYLLPKYWLTWLGVFILYTISWLPYRLQLKLGRAVGRLMFNLIPKRVHVARTNLKLCFPDMPEQEREALLKRNFENAGIALFETGMGWWWPNWRVKRKVTVIGKEHLDEAQAQGKGVLFLAMHYMTVEFACRAIGYTNPMVVFYRPHNNELMEYFQHKGRGRANKYMLGKRDVKGLLGALRDGESCIYLPDQDYGRKKSLFVPFFAVKDTCTTTGTLLFARQKNAQSHFIIPTRNEDESGYTIEIMPKLANFPSDDAHADLTLVNQQLEQAILRAPDQYMWLHRRFKTRPNETDTNLYI